MEQNTAAAVKPKRAKKPSQTSGMSRALVRRETISAYCFLAPALVFFVAFVVIPMFICVFYSLFDYSLGGINGFVGLDNYIQLFQDPVFHKGLINTIIIVLVAVPAVTAFSLWVGSAIYRMNAFTRSFFRCVFYLPVVTGSVAITVVWKWILDPYNGILNQLIGTNGYNWLGEGKTALALHPYALVGGVDLPLPVQAGVHPAVFGVHPVLEPEVHADLQLVPDPGPAVPQRLFRIHGRHLFLTKISGAPAGACHLIVPFSRPGFNPNPPRSGKIIVRPGG